MSLMTRKSIVYKLIYKLSVLVLILLVSTATRGCVFSTMNIVNTRFCNKMKDNILIDSLILYIKNKTFTKFST